MTTSDPSTAAIERAMVAIRRSQTRRSLNRIGARTGRAAIDPTVFGVLDAVQAHDGETTVTDIAAALGVDQPRASRLVGRAIGDGFLRREADQGDARRVLLRLTPAARTALGRAREVRQAAFARATADWPDGERTEFARLLTKFVADFDRVIAESAD
ncbi:MarR family winged helix-turn-helix transcriptional regulator [Nocardia mexicana]|uniref:MarR family winged helix-turn-helix transcriptional regulator n=1 Tax=Nocardia mexicana TaxID=279262 RepID=UPI001FE4D23C|nr:MarR family winged helix-turn-helix transcriptional regulator [Nocardia mexicana]